MMPDDEDITPILRLIRNMADEADIIIAIKDALNRAFDEGYTEGLIDGQDED
jgi:hypothetical protein